MNIKNIKIKWKSVGVILTITLAIFYLIFFLQGLFLMKMLGKVERMYDSKQEPFDANYVTKMSLWAQGKAIIALFIACFGVGFYFLVSKKKLRLEAVISTLIVLILFWLLRGKIS